MSHESATAMVGRIALRQPHPIFLSSARMIARRQFATPGSNQPLAP